MGFTCGQQRVIPASVLSLLSDDNYFVAFLGVTIGKEDAAKIGKWAKHHMSFNRDQYNQCLLYKYSSN